MKKSLLFLSILLITFITQSQIDIKSDNNFTGILSTNTITTFGFNYVGNSSIEFKKLSYDFSTNYSTRFSPQLKENEFIQRQNIGYEKEKWYLFTTHQYNYSLLRKINSDNWLGVGGGLNFPYDWGKISLSYATIYQRSEYFNNEYKELFRHSVRAKFKIEIKKLSFSSEYFFQPNIINFEDIIITGNSKLTLLTNKSINFVIQDVINWRSLSEVRLIHNLSLGIGYKFNKNITNSN